MVNSEPHPFHAKHLLAVDYGRRFSGVATHRVGDDPIIIPYGRIAYKNDEQTAQEILQIVEDEFIDAIILGVPYFTDGTSSKMTQTVLQFSQILISKSSIPVHLQDETLSTKEAEERMRNDPRYNFEVDYTKIDAVAATIILEDFLARNSYDKRDNE